MYDIPKSFFIQTYGCAHNVLDSEVMAGALLKEGLIKSNSIEEADLILLNTCSIRHTAENKAIGKLLSFAKTKRPGTLLGIAGCISNHRKEQLLSSLPHVDFILGTNNLHELKEVVDTIILNGQRIMRTDSVFSHELDYLSAERSDKICANVSIIRGCNKFCTYCIVPHTRGPEISRPHDQILDECKILAEKGYKEVTLLGENVNGYGKDKPETNFLFHDLLGKINDIPGIERIRFITSHPIDISDDLIDAIGELPKVCEYVHFCLQSGSNRILKRMHRMYTKEFYFDRVTKLRKILSKKHEQLRKNIHLDLYPEWGVGTDIIVGFPGETEEEFIETYDMFEECDFTTAYLFMYSPRKGTPSTRFLDDVTKEQKLDRLHRLLALHEQAVANQRKQSIGKIVEVLVEGYSPKDRSFLRGRTRGWWQSVFCGPSELIGTIQLIRVTGFSNSTLIGEMV